MSLPEVVPDQLAGRLLLIRAHLDERAWRLLLGAEAKVLGRGGIKTVAAAAGAHPDTVAQGVRELGISVLMLFTLNSFRVRLQAVPGALQQLRDGPGRDPVSLRGQLRGQP